MQPLVVLVKAQARSQIMHVPAKTAVIEIDNMHPLMVD
jgi:hypothetical protein